MTISVSASSLWATYSMESSAIHLGLALFFAVVVSRVGLRIYRLYVHPLKSFQGLTEACISEDWLYKVTKEGTAEREFEGLHKKFNTKALRIGPNELHITDIELYKVIYNQSKPFLKYAPFYEGFNTPHTVFAEIDSRLHKERRRMLNPMFSKVGVYQLEPLIHEKIHILSSKINRLCTTQNIDIYNAVRLLTTEIITEFAFAKSPNLIEERHDEFDSWFLDAFDIGSQSVVDLQYNPTFRRFVNLLPVGIIGLLNPKLASILNLQKYAGDCMRHWQKSLESRSHPVIFDNLKSLSDDAKVSEAMDILIAGADTTASTLTAGFYHILSNPKWKNRLVQELNETMPEPGVFIPLKSLEKLEFLTACVKESIRIGMAVPGRLPRVVPNGDPLIVDGKAVPPGTIVGMSTYTMHTSVEAWGPDAREFNPDRWIGPNSKELDKWMCTFSKGARMCLGQNVAPAEITLVFAYLFRNHEITLPEGYRAPKGYDRFTLQYESPGLPVTFNPRK